MATAHPPHMTATGTATLLVVEDEIVARNELATMLKTHGYSVESADSGPDAVTKVSEPDSEFSVVLLDIKMPGEFDGIEAACRIQARDREIPIILVTGFVHDSSYQERVQRAGLRVEGWVDKPIMLGNKDTLLHLIERALQKQPVRREIEATLSTETTPAAIQRLLKELNEEFEIAFLAAVIQDVLWMHPTEYPMADELFPGLNLLAYQSRKSELERQYAGSFVAFLEGEFKGADPDRNELIKTIYAQCGRTDILVTRIAVNEPVIKVRHPKRVIP